MTDAFRRAVVAAAVTCSLGSAGRGAEPLQLLIAGDGEVLQLGLDTRLGDRTVAEAWDDSLRALCRFLDRNNDGKLDRRESARLPSNYALRQSLWGQFALDFQPGLDPKLTPVEGDAEPDYATIMAAYRRDHLGDVIVATGRAATTEALNAALSQQLDADGDQCVSLAELRRGAERLESLDRNGDEMIGPGELSETITSYPGTAGTILGQPIRKNDEAAQAIVPLGPMPQNEAAGFKRVVQSATIRVLVEYNESSASTQHAATGSAPWSVHAVSGVRLAVRCAAGRLPTRIEEMRLTAREWFEQVDVDGNDAVTVEEVIGPQQTAIARCLYLADRNEDGRLTREEHAAWVDLQTKLARCHLLVTALDFDRGLFELLDVDHNGGLSLRELRAAAETCTAAGCVVDGQLDSVRVPRCILLTISRGHPQLLLCERARRGPAWFRAMDRNGDGDVSWRECFFDLKTFQRYDRDADGLLSAVEAETLSDTAR